MSGLRDWFHISAIGILAVAAQGADWGCYQGDAARSGVTDDALEFPMAAVWKYDPAQAPAPAWPEPGRELHRMDYDYAFQPVVSGDLVYFGSSSDDSVRAVSAADGKLRWRFMTGGPVRFAPELADGKVYVASDDGFLYCLDAGSGELLWSFRGAPEERMMIGNGRMISRWPCRSGALVLDGVAYFTAGMWPSGGIYLYALDAETGEKIWRNDTAGDMYREQPHGTASAFTGLCPQGYMVASGDTLLVPSGRTTPGAFSRKTGELVYYQPYLYSEPYAPEGWDNRANGGSWVTTAGDLFFCGRHKGSAPDLDAEIGESPPRPGDGLAAYSLETGLREIDLVGKHRAIVHNGVLYAAGDGEIIAADLAKWRETGKLQQDNVKWSKPHGRTYSMILAGRSLLVGGDGTITAFDAGTGRQVWTNQADGQVRGMAVADGRLIVSTDRGGIMSFEANRMDVPAVVVTETARWEVSIRAAQADSCRKMVEKTGVKDGYALVLGTADASLATALASQTDLHVVCALSTSATDTDAERTRLMTTGMYGSRIAVRSLPGEGMLPYSPYFADLVVVAGEERVVRDDEIWRVVRPCGGVVCFLHEPEGYAKRVAGRHKDEVDGMDLGETLSVVRRGPLPGSGEWRYQWADGGRTGVGEEAGVRPPFEILWFGGPGPDRMMPRHWGTSPPLSVDGKVFVTGQHHVIAFDAYNGRELWSRELEGAGRKAAPTRSANFVADNDSLYVATEGMCHRLDQATGRTLLVYHAPGSKASAFNDTGSDGWAKVEWPGKWYVFGPVPQDTPLLDRESLAKVPKELEIGGETYRPVAFRPIKGILDFTCVYGGYGFEPLQPEEKPDPYPRGDGNQDNDTWNKMCYAFAPIHCKTGGTLTIGAGADWWMVWYLDGTPIFSTLNQGNVKKPYAITNHVFSTSVTPGNHTLAVMVKAGALGWSLVSAGGPKYAAHLEAVRTPVEKRTWGYVSAVDDLVLGTWTDSPADENSGEAKGLFALEKEDGTLRWEYRAERGLSNVGIAFGDGRVFLVDGSSPRQAEAEKRLGGEPQLEQTLVALDRESGEELWRQEDVPPMREHLQYAKEVVVVDAKAGYDWKSGKKLWQHPADPERLPVIHDEWIVAQPVAFDLRTGEPRLEPHPLTHRERPWQFARAYGCGQVAGCRDILFFRSGTPGFYDFEKDGTTTFGGVRPGCSVNMIAAAGLMIVPESSAACSCSYNFQTSLALLPVTGEDPWYVLQGEATTDPVMEVHLNFGAPGDKRDGEAEWLAYPRPTMKGSCPVALKMNMETSEWFYEPGNGAESRYPWVASSGVVDPGAVTVSLGKPENPEPGDYLVRLHFAEPDGLEPGERVFDVKVQGEVVLRDYDPVKRGERNGGAVVEEVRHVMGRETMTVELLPKTDVPPILNGLEVLRLGM